MFLIKFEDRQSCRSSKLSLLFACVHMRLDFVHTMPNNSKHVKGIFIIAKAVGSKIHMGQDDLIDYHAQSFQILSRFWFVENILTWLGSPHSFI